jgi:hypothetical protein
MALPLFLAVAIGVVATTWATPAGAAEPEESAAGADEIATPTIYKWIDEHGVAHYTTEFERIPKGLRNRAGRLGPPDAALTRTPADASAPPRRAPSVREFDDGERWAARDRSVDRPENTWDAGDPYADAAGPYQDAPGEDDGLVSELEQEERRRQLVEVDERIASLQTDIAASEEALKVLIAIPVPEGGGPLAMAEDPGFREIAGRLPKLLADLVALEDERAQLEAP